MVGEGDEERGGDGVQSGGKESCANVSDGLRPGYTPTTKTMRGEGETVSKGVQTT